MVLKYFSLLSVLMLLLLYSGVSVIASRILHEICLLIGELAIRGNALTLNVRLGAENTCYIAIRPIPLYV